MGASNFKAVAIVVLNLLLNIVNSATKAAISPRKANTIMNIPTYPVVSTLLHKTDDIHSLLFLDPCVILMNWL